MSTVQTATASPATDTLPAERATIERLVSNSLGRDVCIIASEEITRGVETRRKRRYAKHAMRAADEQGEGFSVFVKTGPAFADPKLERFVSDLNLPEFHAPRYFGEADTDAGHVRVWEFADGEPFHFPTTPMEQFKRVVRAVGAMNCVTDELLRSGANIPVKTRSIEAVAEKVLTLLRDESLSRFPEHNPRLIAEVEALARIEPKALARFSELGDRFFTHQDVSGSNVLTVPSNEALTILDWESASIAVPASGLRALGKFDPEFQKAMVEHYVAFMESNGISLEVADIHFVIRATQVFTALHAAHNRMSHRPEHAFARLRWAVRHFQTHLNV